MFSVGDTVIHNEYGICRITDIRNGKLPGQEPQDYYVMVPLADDEYGTTFYVTVRQESCMRAPLTKEQILSLIDRMPETDPVRIPAGENRTQDAENAKAIYKSLMNSGDPHDWVVLLKTIYSKKQQLSAKRKRISEFESYAMENGERLLYGEIAGVMGIRPAQVERFIARRLEKDGAENSCLEAH